MKWLIHSNHKKNKKTTQFFSLTFRSKQYCTTKSSKFCAYDTCCDFAVSNKQCLINGDSFIEIYEGVSAPPCFPNFYVH